MYTAGQQTTALTLEQKSALSAREASAQAPTGLDVSVPDSSQPVNDTPTLWAQIAGQDNVSAETSQMAAQVRAGSVPAATAVHRSPAPLL